MALSHSRQPVAVARARPTCRIAAAAANAGLSPEYAYLTDLKHHRAADDWKAVRRAKAAAALRTLAGIAPARRRQRRR
jgi:hypothetical protein